jgi:hypothetical protein
VSRLDAETVGLKIPPKSYAPTVTKLTFFSPRNRQFQFQTLTTFLSYHNIITRMFQMVSSIFRSNLPKKEEKQETDAEETQEEEVLREGEEEEQEEDTDRLGEEELCPEDSGISLNQVFASQQMTKCAELSPRPDAVRQMEQEEQEEEEEVVCELEAVIDNALKELKKLTSNTPIKQHKDEEKEARRCPSFPHVASKTILTELKKHGFNDWVESSHTSGIVAKIAEASQFIAFCQDRLKKKYK